MLWKRLMVFVVLVYCICATRSGSRKKKSGSFHWAFPKLRREADAFSSFPRFQMFLMVSRLSFPGLPLPMCCQCICYLYTYNLCEICVDAHLSRDRHIRVVLAHLGGKSEVGSNVKLRLHGRSFTLTSDSTLVVSYAHRTTRGFNLRRLFLCAAQTLQS